MRRHHEVGLAHALLRDRAAEAHEDGTRLVPRNREADELLQLVGAKLHCAARGVGIARVDLALHDGAPGELARERHGAREDGGDVARVHAALEAVARLGMQAVAPRRTADAPRVEVGALEQDALGGRLDLADGAAHDARERRRALTVADEEIVRAELALHAVERLHDLALGGASHDDLRAAHEVQVERMHRVAVLEHHEVRDVDDVRDGAHAERRQAVAGPERRRADGDVDDGGGAVVRTALGVVDGDLRQRGDVLGAHAGGGRGLGRLPREAEDRRDVAREADVPEAVGAVGREIELVHDVLGGGDDLGEDVARCAGAGGQHDDAVALVGEPELRLAAEHALARDAGDGAPFDGHALRGQVRAEGREDDEAARLRHVRRAAHDLLGAAAALHRDEAKAALRGMRADGGDLRDHTGAGALPEARHAVDGEARAGQAGGELFGGCGQVRDELPEPAVRGLHGDVSYQKRRRASTRTPRSWPQTPRSPSGARGPPCRARPRAPAGAASGRTGRGSEPRGRRTSRGR